MSPRPAVAVSARCQGCGACLLTCPTHAIRPIPHEVGGVPLLVLDAACTGCLECVDVCPVDAIDIITDLSDSNDSNDISGFDPATEERS